MVIVAVDTENPGRLTVDQQLVATDDGRTETDDLRVRFDNLAVRANKFANDAVATRRLSRPGLNVGQVERRLNLVADETHRHVVGVRNFAVDWFSELLTVH